MISAVIGHTYASGTPAASLASDGPAAPPLPPSPPPAHIPAYIRSNLVAPAFASFANVATLAAPAFASFANVAALAAPAAARSADNAALVAAAHARARSAASTLDSSWSAFSCRHAASCRAASCRAASFRAASCRHASFLSCGAGARNPSARAGNPSGRALVSVAMQRRPGGTVSNPWPRGVNPRHGSRPQAHFFELQSSLGQPLMLKPWPAAFAVPTLTCLGLSPWWSRGARLVFVVCARRAKSS
eukprot:scaffold66816_cov52-Phaeocystis_antarctica.AAC.3